MACRRIDFYLDRHRTGTVTSEDAEAQCGDWPFDKLHTPILNVAVGGWAGQPDTSWATAQGARNLLISLD